MTQVQRLCTLVFVTAAAIYCAGMAAQAGDPATQIQNKLVSQVKLTKATADRSDIVTPGDVVVLQKDGLMMCSTASSYAFSNTYNNGVLSANYNNRAKDAAKSYAKAFGLSRLGLGGGASVTDAANNGCPSRKFVAGEKFWITGIVAQKDGILVSTFSDPFGDTRYFGELKFPFVKGSVPRVDDFVKTFAEVITVQPADDSGNQGDQGSQGNQDNQAAAAPAPAPAPAAAPMQDIAPPPPPADAPPPTIALGQTKSQVTTAFGQPVRMAKLGVKEIYYYKDMKVTFTNGKVSNVE
ncbi:MAG: hypothetical protein ABSE55_09310 [Terracidiphilus sp.]|jgi:hypothetical protein